MATIRSTKSQNIADKTESDSSFSSSPASPPLPPRRRSASPTPTLSQALAGTAHLANLLPTGTLLAFQLLTPVFTHNGSCDSTTRLMTIFLLLLLAASAFAACFTDSLRLHDGRVIHGLATLRGIWLFEPVDSSAVELAGYRLRFIDCIHAVLSALVFAAVALRDKNVVRCLYPSPAKSTEEVLDVLPLGIGVICSLLFVVFPTTRRGVGHPVSMTRSSGHRVTASSQQ
ncbi:hypothetical protein M5K25_000631 [Dendrobium thyrsiflorum]|uniref:Uncharacterized protein n=1 Tax=Dendrobium thyrsiflorum TaxID=117978 RepID=A0ABD0W7Q8_DENTH